MDNEKKAEFLRKILEKGKGQGQAANENPAIDQEKVLKPLKDESTTPSTEKDNSSRTQDTRNKTSGAGRGMGGGGNTSSTQPEGEHKTPAQKIIEKGEQKPFRGGGGGGSGGSDDSLKDKKDFINPNDLLSDKGTGKQQKQEPQQQQAEHKPAVTEKPAVNARDVLNRVKEVKEKSEIPDKEAGISKEANQLSIKERIAKAVTAKEDQPVKNNSANEKSVEMAVNKVKSPSPKTPKL